MVVLPLGIRKAQVNRGRWLLQCFLTLKKAYDLMWKEGKEGLLIKIKRLGITGPMYNWTSFMSAQYR